MFSKTGKPFSHQYQPHPLISFLEFTSQTTGDTLRFGIRSKEEKFSKAWPSENTQKVEEDWSNRKGQSQRPAALETHRVTGLDPADTAI